VGTMSRRRQIWYALEAIDQRGTSKHEAKRWCGYSPGQAVPGVFSDGYTDTVFDRRLNFTHWLGEHYPEVRHFRDLDTSLLTDYLGEKSQVCRPPRSGPSWPACASLRTRCGRGAGLWRPSCPLNGPRTAGQTWQAEDHSATDSPSQQWRSNIPARQSHSRR